MTCPEKIAPVILEILTVGLLRIRACAWESNVDRCAIEADHLHNLPRLLAEYTPEALAYYWEVERPSFQARSAGEDFGSFSVLWDRLEASLPVPSKQPV
jgi:hypothetical protein